MKRAEAGTEQLSSCYTSLKTKNYSMHRWGEVQFLSQNAQETVWRPGPPAELLAELTALPYAP